MTKEKTITKEMKIYGKKVISILLAMSIFLTNFVVAEPIVYGAKSGTKDVDSVIIHQAVSDGFAPGYSPYEWERTWVNLPDIIKYEWVDTGEVRKVEKEETIFVTKDIMELKKVKVKDAVTKKEKKYIQPVKGKKTIKEKIEYWDEELIPAVMGVRDVPVTKTVAVPPRYGYVMTDVKENYVEQVKVPAEYKREAYTETKKEQVFEPEHYETVTEYYTENEEKQVKVPDRFVEENVPYTEYRNKRIYVKPTYGYKSKAYTTYVNKQVKIPSGRGYRYITRRVPVTKYKRVRVKTGGGYHKTVKEPYTKYKKQKVFKKGYYITTKVPVRKQREVKKWIPARARTVDKVVTKYRRVKVRDGYTKNVTKTRTVKRNIYTQISAGYNKQVTTYKKEGYVKIPARIDKTKRSRYVDKEVEYTIKEGYWEETEKVIAEAVYEMQLVKVDEKQEPETIIKIEEEPILEKVGIPIKQGGYRYTRIKKEDKPKDKPKDKPEDKPEDKPKDKPKDKPIVKPTVQSRYDEYVKERSAFEAINGRNKTNSNKKLENLFLQNMLPYGMKYVPTNVLKSWSSNNKGTIISNYKDWLKRQAEREVAKYTDENLVKRIRDLSNVIGNSKTMVVSDGLTAGERQRLEDANKALEELILLANGRKTPRTKEVLDDLLSRGIFVENNKNYTLVGEAVFEEVEVFKKAGFDEGFKEGILEDFKDLLDMGKECKKILESKELRSQIKEMISSKIKEAGNFIVNGVKNRTLGRDLGGKFWDLLKSGVKIVKDKVDEYKGRPLAYNVGYVVGKIISYNVSAFLEAGVFKIVKVAIKQVKALGVIASDKVASVVTSVLKNKKSSNLLDELKEKSMETAADEGKEKVKKAGAKKAEDVFKKYEEEIKRVAKEETKGQVVKVVKVVDMVDDVVDASGKVLNQLKLKKVLDKIEAGDYTYGEILELREKLEKKKNKGLERTIERVNEILMDKTGCFEEGTLVVTKEGLKPIEDIAIGDYVYSMDMETGAIESEYVYDIYAGRKDELVEIETETEVVKATKEHPMWIEGKGWEKAKDVKAGDYLRKGNGERERVKEVKEKEAKGTKIYNLSVNKNHNYMVTKEGILTHNENCNVKFLMEVYVNKGYVEEVLEAVKEGKVDKKLVKEIEKELMKNPAENASDIYTVKKFLSKNVDNVDSVDIEGILKRIADKSFRKDKEAREHVRKSIGGERKYYTTKNGGRYIEVVVDKVGHETNVGYQYLSKATKEKIDKDVLIRTTDNDVEEIVWHFFEDGTTKKQGPSKPLKEYLEKNNIRVEVHEGTGNFIKNLKGVFYPEIIDLKTGEPIKFPKADLVRVSKENRVGWFANQSEANKFRTNSTDILCKKDFIDEWYKRGYGAPPLDWKQYDIHHIHPREFGGSASFDNLTPVLRSEHQKQVTPWWNAFGDK